jgi:periplasmic protein TonB
MLADSLLDRNSDRSARAWTTLASFAAQILGLSVLLIVPLIYHQALPQLGSMGAVIAPPPLAPGASPIHARFTSVVGHLPHDIRMIEPSRIPRAIETVIETAPPPTIDLAGLGVQGGTAPREALNPVLNSIGNTLNSAAPPRPPSVRPLRRSVTMEGNLVHRVQPEYPARARSAGIQGPVLLRAVISRQGRIENLQVLAGHPMLVKAALDALRQWRYRPYILNNEPVEVETQVTVNFVLSGG